MEPRTLSGSEGTQPSELPYIENGNRREYATWFKFQVVNECTRPGASVSIVARQYNINTNVVFRWRREIQLGLLKLERPPHGAPFVTVGVIGEDGKLEPVEAPAPSSKPTITLPPPAPPADVSHVAVKTLPVPASSPTPRSSVGVIEMQLSGRIKIRIEGDVNKDTLRRVLAVAREFA